MATVLEWLDEAQAEGSGPKVHTNIGFLRWGFVHAFRQVLSYSVRNVSVEGARCLCDRRSDHCTPSVEWERNTQLREVSQRGSINSNP